MRPSAERQVLAPVVAVEAERAGVLVHRFVTVRRCDAEDDLLTGAHGTTEHVGRLLDVAQQLVDRRVDAQRFLDGALDERPVGGEGVEQGWVRRDGRHEVGDEMSSGLVARDDEEHQLGSDLDRCEAMAVDLGLEQAGHEIIGPLT